MKFKPGTLQELKAFELLEKEINRLADKVMGETGCDAPAIVRGVHNAIETFSEEYIATKVQR